MAIFFDTFKGQRFKGYHFKGRPLHPNPLREDRQPQGRRRVVRLVGTFTCLLALGLTGCGSAASKASDESVLKVGMECAYAPYNWAQNTDADGAVPIQGSPEFANGYDVQTAKALAERLGKTLVIVRSDWDSLVPAVQSGVVDCVIAGQSITPERLQNVDFTKPYYYASLVTLVREDSPYAQARSIQDLKGARATSQLNTVWYDKALPQIPQVTILPGQADAPAMLLALVSQTADLIVTDRPTAQAALKVYPNLKLLDFEGQTGDYQVDASDIEIGISVRKGNQALLDQLNSVLTDWTRADQDQRMQQAIEAQAKGRADHD